jgi:hypothetical protein
MSPDIQNILGFSKDPNVERRAVHFQGAAAVKKTPVINVVAPHSHHVDYNIPSEINVCLDIVKEQPIVGKLLRKVSVYQFQYGETKSIVFDRPHYVKVNKKYFDTLHVDLKDAQGENLPFQFGTSNVTLHFKRQ